MRNNVLFRVLALVCVVFITSAASFKAGPKNDFVMPFEELREYNVLMTSAEGGVFEYAGVKDELRFSFLAKEDGVDQIKFMFPEGARATYIPNVIDLTNKLMPEKLKEPLKAQERLEKKLGNIKKNKDAFKIEKVRVEAAILQNMMHIRITK